MLCVNSYTQDYIDGCRSRMESQLAAYRALAAAASANPGRSKSTVASAVDAFEPLFFSHLVVVLDGFFVHRSRTLEQKDGNPLNEVRMLCNSVLQNRGVLAADKTIKFNPAKSVVKLQVGDAIKLTEADFVHLSKAFFSEIEAKFGK
jgi:hypothetical protein